MAEKAEALIVDDQAGAPAPDDALPEQQSEQTAFEAESVARLAGWAPKEEWRGPEEEWKDAATFVTERVTGFDAAKKQAKTLKKTLETTTRTMERTLQQQRDTALAEAEARARRAVEDNDPAAAIAAVRQVREVEASRPAPEFSSFQERNAGWWNVDPEATAFAIGLGNTYAAQGMSAAEQFEAAEKAVKKRFPEHFEDTPSLTPAKPQPRAPLMGGGQRSSQPRKGPITLADLPREAQDAAKRFEKRGVKMSDFLKNWEEENGR